MFTDFYDAYHFLKDHPICIFENENHFERCLDIEVVKVNPQTNCIDDDYTKNTQTRVWLEFGAVEENTDEFIKSKYVYCHDINLDCGGNTFEEAIIELANLVYKYYPKYNNYKEKE